MFHKGGIIALCYVDYLLIFAADSNKIEKFITMLKKTLSSKIRETQLGF